MKVWGIHIPYEMGSRSELRGVSQSSNTGWRFGTFFIFPYIFHTLGIIIPID